MGVTLGRTVARILFFRFDREDTREFGPGDLIVGFVLTWLAGIGRYWDNERVGALQQAGLGSLAYVLVLSAFLFVLGIPLRNADWTYFRVLCFVTHTAPPAFLYAIPVERFLSPGGAQSANLAFLAVVSTWRVALWATFLARFARLSPGPLAILLFLPLCLIVFGLTALNLEQAAFDLMGGLDAETSADDSYATLVVLSVLSVGFTPVLLAAYLVTIWPGSGRRRRR